MVLQNQSTAIHNQMLGQRIRHPPSTNFDDEYDTPVAKRLKRYESTDSSLSRVELEDGFPQSPTRTVNSRGIPDSEIESEDDDVPQAHSSYKTELESALPSMKTDKEAIADYEASRAAEVIAPLDLEGRLGQRKWVPGKSSIYVDAFNLVLETVLDDEALLFDEAEMGVFQHWRTLSYEAQYLYVIYSSNQLYLVVSKLLTETLDMYGCFFARRLHGIV